VEDGAKELEETKRKSNDKLTKARQEWKQQVSAQPVSVTSGLSRYEIFS
jgi:hypothetical protein